MSIIVKRMLVLLLMILQQTGPTAACDSSCSSNCDCEGLGLTSVPQDLPTTITILDLERNAITTLGLSDFTRYASLVQLELNSNQLSTLPANLFTGLGNLQRLDLQRNQLTSLPSDTFVGLSNLQELRLYFNELTTLLHDIFVGLGNLRLLDLQWNQLTTLPHDIFVGLVNLAYLSIARNSLTNLPANIFDELGNLTYLSISENSLTTLPANIFADLSNLVELYLSRNQLTTLRADAFAGLGSLQRLSLLDNQLTSLPGSIFAGLGSLQSLSLYDNQLTTLPARIFAGLGNLLRLYLYDNQLTSLPTDTFAGLSNLEYLYLYGNQLTSLPAGLFAGMGNLLRLFLSENQLTSLPASIFAGLSNLERLYFFDNQLTSLPADLFAGLDNLETLRLYENQLTTLPADVFDTLASISKLGIEDNPWQCDCRMGPFKQRMTGSHRFERSIICAGPGNLTGHSLLLDVSLGDLTCDEQATCTDNPPPALDATCICNPGYEGDGFANGTGCTAVQCPVLVAPDNGALDSGDNSYGDEVGITCEPGYEAAVDTVTCQANATWTAVPACNAIPSRCEPNPCQNGGSCTDVFPTSYSCKCRYGYTGDDCEIGCLFIHPKFRWDRFGIYDNRCLWFAKFKYRANYAGAERFCQSRGATLVTIKTSAKQKWLEGYIRHITRWAYWTGLNDRANETSYMWPDGTAWNASYYNNWPRKRPPKPNQDRDCVLLNVRRQRWNVVNCNKRNRFICEMVNTIT